VSGFFKELKRRKVYTVAVAYVVVAWLILQVADVVLPIYDTPDWVLRTFTTLLFLGFPIALVLAWAYDISSGGIVKTPDEPENEKGPAIELPSGPSIAVLPFRNLSSDSEQSLFADALCGDIVTGLTQSSHLFVLSPGATAGLENDDQDVREIGAQLGVSYLLRGSVQKSGETLRVSATLMDTANGVQIWSQNYDREMSAENMFSMQDDIREQVVATLSDLHGVIYSTQTQKNVHRPTNSLNAYECLSVALVYDKYISRENHLQARESLERAAELDPQFDEAWAHLSWIYTDEYVYGFNLLADPMERALDAARKGVRLAPGNYHNHWLLSRVHYFMGKRDLFLAESQKALKLNSSDGTTLGLIGMYTAFAGDWDHGIGMMSKAKLLNPNFPDYYHLVFGCAAFAKHDYADALNEIQKANLSDFPLFQMFLTSSYAWLNQPEDAARQCEELARIQPGISQEIAMDTLQKTFPFQPGLVEKVLDGLTRAGLDGSDQS
jgi:TolB-like protein